MFPQHLTRWTLPPYYAGVTWPGYYVSLSQHRDSDTLARSNFRTLLRRLGGESSTVCVVREGHWAVGWLEWIAIHQADVAALALADALVGKLADYPVLDEDDWSELEYATAGDVWAGMSVADRVQALQRHGGNIFAARRADLPSTDSGELVSYLADGV